jgi:outer membrane protein assembly factor BamB
VTDITATPQSLHWSPTAAPPRRRPRRLWMPAGTLLLAALAVSYFFLSEEMEPHHQFMATALVVLVTPILLAGWLLLFSGLRWLHRYAILAGCAFAVFGTLVVLFGFLLRHEGSVSGSGVPRFVWRWTPHVEASLDDLRVEPPAPGEAAIDLAAAADTDYPQFLGARRDGVVRGVRLDPDWQAHPPQELWRRPIGLGCSAFAVVGDYAVTQEQRGDKELVVCYELKKGKVRWTHADEARFRDVQGGDGPRATPTVSGGRVYAAGATGILNCLDGGTGERKWSRDTLVENKLDNIEWGKSCSPLVFDDKVVVSGGKGGPSLLAYHKDSGEPLWKVGDEKTSYSSPVLATLAKQKQVLMVNQASVTAHDPADGHVLWTYPWPGEWAKASQPVPLPGDRVFLSAGYGVGCVLLQVKRDGDRLEAAELWSHRRMRTQFSNVVVAHDCAFGIDNGVLACIDLDGGEQKWKGDRYGYGQVMLAGDLLLIQAESGAVVLAEAGPDGHRELARLPALSSKTWNNPALSGPYLLVRNDREAACYRLPIRPAPSR